MKSPSSQWISQARKKLESGSFGSKILLSFFDEEEYNDFNKCFGRNKYTILYTLANHETGRFHVWVSKR